MFPRTDFMGVDECGKLIYARKPRRIGLFSPHFLTAEPRTQRGLRGQNECHLSMFVLGNISTAFLALSVDGNISIHDKK